MATGRSPASTTSGNGIFQGYRWYDQHDVTPLFAFGHGLSYTLFTYSDLKAKPTATGLETSFTIRNVGPRTGAEVAQVYIGPSASSAVPLAERALVGFERVELNPDRRSGSPSRSPGAACPTGRPTLIGGSSPWAPVR